MDWYKELLTGIHKVLDAASILDLRLNSVEMDRLSMEADEGLLTDSTSDSLDSIRMRILLMILHWAREASNVEAPKEETEDSEKTDKISKQEPEKNATNCSDLKKLAEYEAQS